MNGRPKARRKIDVWHESINIDVGNYTLWTMVELSGDTPEFYLAPALLMGT